MLELSWALLSASRMSERAGITAATAAEEAQAEAAEAGDDISTEEKSEAESVVSRIYPPSLPLSRLRSLVDYAWTFGLRSGGVVPGAGGLWRGVKDFDSDSVSSDTDKDKGEWWAEFEGMVAALHEWELTGNRVARDRFTHQLSVLYGYFADWSPASGVRAVITEEQRRGEEPEPEPKLEPGRSVGRSESTSKRSARKDPFYTVRGVLEAKRVLAHGVTRVRLGQ